LIRYRYHVARLCVDGEGILGSTDLEDTGTVKVLAMGYGERVQVLQGDQIFSQDRKHLEVL
jgi:hypothetical protein